MVLIGLPPTVDSAPQPCLCGRDTVESHEFLFCSTECARQDALQSLVNPNCHYRDVVHRAYAGAGAPQLRPRRMASGAYIRRSPSDLARVAPWTAGDPAFAPLSGKAPARQATAEQLAADRHDRSRWESLTNVPLRARLLVPQPGGHTFAQPRLGAVPLSEHGPSRPLRRVPSSFDAPQNDKKKSSVAGLLNFGRSRKGKEAEDIWSPFEQRRSFAKGGTGIGKGTLISSNPPASTFDQTHL